MHATDRSITLTLYADAALVPLAQKAVEQAALVFGMPQERVMRLVMAADEIVSYLAQTAPGEAIKMTVAPGGWCVRVDFSFVATPSDLWVINFATGKKARSGQIIDNLGLLLASRMMDSFSVKLHGREVHLELRLDYPYQSIERQEARFGTVSGPVKILDEPEAALIQKACAAAVNLYPPHLVHSAFYTPGKAADMVACGALDMLVAVDGQGQLVGMMSWFSPSEHSLSFSGPYVFATGGPVAEALEMRLLQRVGRGPAESLFSDLATEHLLCENFEPLGQLDYRQNDGQVARFDVWFRLLKEDAGATVWGHPGIVDFLKKTYADLCLMRTIRTVDVAGEMRPERSVFSARLKPKRKEAVLVPLIVGNDVAQSLGMQVAALREDDYHNIFFHLDLAYGWQAGMSGALLENGFRPRLLLPGGGTGDVVVFQHA